MNKLLKHFERCWNAKYTHVENDASYAIERDGDTLYLLFQKSNGLVDWKNNFDFPAEPYTGMEIPWKCHRGFLKVWKSIEPYIIDAVRDLSIKEVVVIGYSHGAAIATLAHEYVWYHRPDLRDNLIGFGYGAPRCYWGWTIPEALKERWKNFYIVRNNNDIVTYVPPVLFGFVHVGRIVSVGKKGEYALRKNKLVCIDDHRPENYIYSLNNYEETV